MIESVREFSRVSKPYTRDGVEAGDYVCIPGQGWGRVLRIEKRNGAMLVDLFALRPDPGPQDFPEYDLMQRAEQKVRIADWPIAEICEAKLNSPLGSTALSRPSEAIHSRRYPA